MFTIHNSITGWPLVLPRAKRQSISRATLAMAGDSTQWLPRHNLGTLFADSLSRSRQPFASKETPVHASSNGLQSWMSNSALTPPASEHPLAAQSPSAMSDSTAFGLPLRLANAHRFLSLRMLSKRLTSVHGVLLRVASLAMFRMPAITEGPDLQEASEV